MLKQNTNSHSNHPKSKPDKYSSDDLTSLSASILYKEKEYIKSTDTDSTDNSTLHFYNKITPKEFGSTEFIIQNPGETHKEYKERLKSGEGTVIAPPATISSGDSY